MKDQKKYARKHNTCKIVYKNLQKKFTKIK